MEPPLARFLRADHPLVLESVESAADSVTLGVPRVRQPRRTERTAATRTTSRKGKAALLTFGLLAAVLVLLAVSSLVGVAARMASPQLALGAGWHVDVAEGLVHAGGLKVYREGPVRWLANRAAGPVRVGLQVGHLNAGDQPEELAVLRYSTGAHAAGLTEVDVNHAVATALAERLMLYGFEVDVLPATVPPGYLADVLLSLHSDASEDTARSGYKSAHFSPARNPREALLKVAVDRAVLTTTAFVDDDRNVSGNMLHYYAFNSARFEHAAAARTPALIVELGYLSNPADARLLTQPDTLAAALEGGVLRYLEDIGRWRGAW